MTAKQMPAAELRRNLAGFEKALRDQAESFAAYLTDDYSGSGYARGILEGQRDGYRMALKFLHIWTDGEFGDETPGIEDAPDVTE